jgi:hypothetical protein
MSSIVELDCFLDHILTPYPLSELFCQDSLKLLNEVSRENFGFI